MVVKAVIFDMDGTLADSEEAWFTAASAATIKFSGKPLNHDEFRERIWLHGSMGDFLRERFGEAAGEALACAMKAVVKSKGLVRAFDGELETLERLSHKYWLAIASNTDSEVVAAFLGRLGIAHFFGAVICTDMVKKRKPDPEMLFLACKGLGVDAGEAVEVGDMARDVEAAKAAGMRSVSFMNRNDGADAYAADYAELERIINAWGK